MKKNYFFFIVLFLYSVLLFSQQKKVDEDSLQRLQKLISSQLSDYQYKEVIENSYLLISQSQKINSDLYHFHGHNYLGVSYEDLNDSIRSKKNYEYALEYAEKLENDTLKIWAYNNLGNSYSQNKSTKDVGINYYKKVIDLARSINSEYDEFAPTVNIAWTYIDNEEYKLAKPYLDKAHQLFLSNESELVKAQLYTLTGKYHIGTGELDEATQYLETSIEIVDRDSLLLQASHAYEQYANLLFKKENFKEAYLALAKYNKYKAELFQKEKLAEIQVANIKFDVGEYQRDLDRAKTEQIYKDEVIEKSEHLMIVMIISSIILLIILIILYILSRSRRRINNELSNRNKELIEAKEEADRLSTLKTNFFSTISHELRTPLYGVIGLTSILMEDKTLKKHEEDLKSLKFSADYLLALINDVLQMNKMESNLLKLEQIPFNPKEVIKGIVKSFEFTRLQNKNNIHLNLDSKISTKLLGDPVRLSQIMMNLVGNAMKFTERGNIWINITVKESSHKNESIYFEIKDDGLGIPKNKQELIFEEFSQLKSSNYNYQGTGLGLPIVKKLLHLYNSEIILESEEGKGSIFSFEITFEKLLVDNQLEAAIQPENAIASHVNNENEKRILIVDDNRINQIVTQRILEQYDFICEVCDNGSLAIERIRNSNFDLVLMDVNMPGISGLEATKQIRTFNDFIPIIALTAVEVDEIREEITKAGMNDIIVKPYDTSTFFQVIYRNMSAEIISN